MDVGGSNRLVFGPGLNQPVRMMQSMQPGDRFKATIDEIKPGELTLRLPNGETLHAGVAKHSVALAGAKIGDTAWFEVQTNESGQIKLTFSEHSTGMLSGAGEFTQMATKALQSVGLPITQENLEAVAALIERQFPLDVTLLEKAAYLMNAFKGMTGEKVAVMLQQQLQMNQQTADEIGALLENKASIRQSGEAVFRCIAGQNNHLLRNGMAALLSNQFMEEQDKAVIRSILSEHAHLADDEKGLKEALTAQFGNNMPDNKLAVLIQTLCRIDKRAAMHQMRKSLYLEPDKNSRADTMLQKLGKGVSDLSHLLEMVGDKIPFCAKLSEPLTTMQKELALMNQFGAETAYVQIPFVANRAPNESKLFVFENKKKNGSRLKSALIALDLAQLGHLDALVIRDTDRVSCQFTTENERICTIMQQGAHKLTKLLEQHGFRVGQLNFEVRDKELKTVDVLAPTRNAPDIRRFDFDMRV